MAIYNFKYKNFYNGIFKVKGEILDYGLLRRYTPRNDAVASLLSLRECVAFVAIYNYKYRNFYNGIFKVKGEILDYGLLRFARND